jgi:hypothetical protein
LVDISAGAITDYTSISAYDDIVICAFDYYDSEISCEYYITRDAGENWGFGYFDSLTLRSESADVTAKLGAGLAASYRYYTPTREDRFAYRDYDPGSWGAREAISDHEPNPNKSSIEYMGSGTYGIVYLSWNTPPVRAAYFDKGSFGCSYVLGDINGNGVANGIDVTYGVGYLKGGSVPPVNCGTPVGPCPEASPFYAAGDVNGSCVFNGIDITYYVTYLKGGAALNSCISCPPAGTALLAPAAVPNQAHQIDAGNSVSGE